MYSAVKFIYFGQEITEWHLTLVETINLNIYIYLLNYYTSRLNELKLKVVIYG